MATRTSSTIGALHGLRDNAEPLVPTVYRRGAQADAEPAVPGWRLAVDELFE